jgi:hypothetical protein
VADNASPHARRAWHWLMPSLSQWLWLMFLLILLSQPWRTVMVASDGDACMHWRVGEWMLEQKQIIRTDVFSHSRYGRPIISKEWLAEIIFAIGGRLGGLFGVSAVGALLIATTFALLHRQLLREGNEIFTATGVTVMAAWAANAHWMARPHAFSFLLALLWHDALRHFERTMNTRALAVSLGVLMLLWVNLHGAFLAGFAILGAYWLGAAVARDRHKLIVLTAVALECALVSLANPNGYKLHLHNLQFLHSEFYTNWLAEYSSVRFDSPDAIGFSAWLALMFLTLAVKRPRIRAGEAVLLISWTYFALYSIRNVPLLAILSAPIIAPPLSDAVRAKWGEQSLRLQRANETARGWPAVGLAAIAALVFISHPTEMPAKNWPVDALTFIREHPDRFTGNMFNQYAWGGYLMEELPGHKVFVDGRADFYGEELLKEFDQTTALRSNWVAVLDKYDVAWTLMPSDHRLNLALALLRPQWSCIYTDEVAQIWRKPD